MLLAQINQSTTVEQIAFDTVVVIQNGETVRKFQGVVDNALADEAVAWAHEQVEGNDYTHGKPYRDGQTFFRRDTYLPTGSIDRLFVLDTQDNSPIHKHWRPGKYNSECSCCYLGFAHSEELHNHRIGQAR